MNGQAEALLRVEGITKAYPGVIANDDVSFAVGPGEIHALLGENGAGKSTLVKIIYGLVRPDAGRMWLAGRPFRPADPTAARTAGVGMVFQHFSLFEALDVAENVALGMETAPPQRKLARSIREVSRAYGLPLDPSRLVGELSAGERQRVEIIRCLLQDPRLLIMDEPTSVLTPQEVDILFRTLRKLAGEGTSILYISHKLEEIRALCERATILRQGRVVATCDPRETTAGEMAEMMVGSALRQPTRAAGEPGPVVLEVKGLTLKPASPFGTTLRDVTLEVRAGEIFGIGGVAGNGQDELLGALSGEVRLPREAVRLQGAPVGRLGPGQRRALGLLTAPEERLGHAAAPDLTLTENALMTGAVRERLVSAGFINWARARAFAERIVERFDVRTPGTEVAARALSGGNLQKFVIGREIMQRPAVLVVNQPTWGVDAQAAAAIRQALMDLATEGAAVLVISQDLEELMEIADRFAALNGGRLSVPRPMRELTLEEIGLMLGGAHDMDVAADDAHDRVEEEIAGLAHATGGAPPAQHGEGRP
jgi:general nucleoside transport system ATP-binding protein